MGFISISDLEQATGTTITDEPKAQFMIDSISAWIETYTGRYFSLQENVVLRCQADAYGLIEIEDLDDVTSVVDWKTDTAASGWDWDGMSTIYGLCSFQTVDATVTYGFEEPPLDIVGVCTELVAEGLHLPLISGALTSQRVGDVERRYNVTVAAGGDVMVTPSYLQTKVLDKYAVRNRTLRIGRPSFPRSTNVYPTL